MEAEGFIQRAVVDEDREQGEHIEQMELANSEQLSRVSHTPVTEFVCQNSFDFLVRALLQESIVDDNLLLPGQTSEISVAMSTALTTINNLKLCERKLERSSQSFDTLFQGTRLQR